MQELMSKSAMSATSPVARTGGGDISEREFSRERHNLQTPPTRIQRTHPKRQLFSAPVNKFTARPPGSSSNLVRIRSCLNEYNKPGVTPRKRAVAKAASMEDLTPGKIKKAEQCKAIVPLHVVPRVWSGLKSEESDRAAARVSRFMLLAAWRRRREEVRCLKKTLINQVSCSERLRLQVSSLKTLVESDSSKVRLAIRELERLRQRLHDKDEEKAVLQREKTALEKDVIAAEDKASECSIGSEVEWRASIKVGMSTFTPNGNRVTMAQLEILYKFLKRNRNLATGSNKSLADRATSRKQWKKVSVLLNAQENGAVKKFVEWVKYWNNRKSKLNKRVEAGGAGSLRGIDAKLYHVLVSGGWPHHKEQLTANGTEAVSINKSSPASSSDGLDSGSDPDSLPDGGGDSSASDHSDRHSPPPHLNRVTAGSEGARRRRGGRGDSGAAPRSRRLQERHTLAAEGIWRELRELKELILPLIAAATAAIVKTEQQPRR